MINHLYEAVCDNCGDAEHLHGIQNKTELKTELEARGWSITYQFKIMLCEDCNDR